MGTLCVSTGTPRLTAGDMRGRTQGGKNNAHLHDNVISWIDWSADNAWLDVYEITKAALRLRREHPALRQRPWFEGRPAIQDGPTDLAWLHPLGREVTGDGGFEESLAVIDMFVSAGPRPPPRPRRAPQATHTSML